MTDTDTSPPGTETEKHNLRIGAERWSQAVKKVTRMARDGYLSIAYVNGQQGAKRRLSVTDIVCAALDRFIDESDADTAIRLGLKRGDAQ